MKWVLTNEHSCDIMLL